MFTFAFPTGTETQASLASEIPQLWGERVNDFYKMKLVNAPFYTDRSAELADGGNTLYTPALTEMTANAKANAATVTLNAPSDPKISLLVNNWYECSFAIEDLEAAQLKKSYVLMERYAKNCGYEIAKTLDRAITALYGQFTNTVGSSTTNLADSDIRNAIAYLDSNDVPSEEAAFFMSPNVFWKQIQALDKFSLAVNSPVNDPTSKMPAAFLYGRKVWVTNTIQFISGTTGRWNALAVDDAIHWATSPLGGGGSEGQMVGSMGIRVQSNYIPQYLSTVTTADIAYGVIINRAIAGVNIATPA